MKQILLFAALLLCVTTSVAQKKPTIMVLPSDNWCTQRYFTSTYENQGEFVRVPNYAQAFQEDIELPPVISKIGEIMIKLGYSLKDAEQELKSVNARQQEDNVTHSKTSGAIYAESPLDILKRKAKADIILQLGWVLNREPNGASVTFTLEAFDAYTSKRIATVTGTDKGTFESIPLHLQHAVERNIKQFDKQLDSYFSDIKKNGREIILTVRCWDNWENDLEAEYDGEELLYHIQKWLNDNTVNSSFNLSDATENVAQFEQVRIPLKDRTNMDLDARSFARNLQKYLAKNPFNINSKIIIRGLGEATIILGEK